MPVTSKEEQEQNLAISMLQAVLEHTSNDEAIEKALEIWIGANFSNYAEMLDTIDIVTVSKRAVDDFTKEFPEARGQSAALVQHMIVAISRMA